MKKLLILLAFAFLFLSLTSASSFDERKKYLLDYYSKARPNDQYWGDNDIKTAMGFVLARLETKKDVKYALNMLNRMQEDLPSCATRSGHLRCPRTCRASSGDS